MEHPIIEGLDRFTMLRNGSGRYKTKAEVLYELSLHSPETPLTTICKRYDELCSVGIIKELYDNGTTRLKYL